MIKQNIHILKENQLMQQEQIREQNELKLTYFSRCVYILTNYYHLSPIQILNKSSGKALI